MAKVDYETKVRVRDQVSYQLEHEVSPGIQPLWESISRTKSFKELLSHCKQCRIIHAHNPGFTAGATTIFLKLEGDTPPNNWGFLVSDSFDELEADIPASYSMSFPWLVITQPYSEE